MPRRPPNWFGSSARGLARGRVWLIFGVASGRGGLGVRGLVRAPAEARTRKIFREKTGVFDDGFLNCFDV